jgi:hypothetical protein
LAVVMAEFREDTTVYPVMIELNACLCAEITSSGLPEPCVCELLPGGDVAFDYCTECDDGRCGQAWVRLVAAYPSQVLGEPDTTGNCATRLSYTLEVGIIRCAPLPGNDGSPPSVDAQLSATRLQLADMQAMRRAIACCMGADVDRDYILEPYTPYPVLGGCVGGFWTVTTW